MKPIEKHILKKAIEKLQENGNQLSPNFAVSGGRHCDPCDRCGSSTVAPNASKCFGVDK